MIPDAPGIYNDFVLIRAPSSKASWDAALYVGKTNTVYTYRQPIMHFKSWRTTREQITDAAIAHS